MEELSFEKIAMGLVGELTESEEVNPILVITDRFTKALYYIPTMTTWTATELTNIYFNAIWRLYGLPKHITLDSSP